jgi:hypothetical protein
MISLREPEIAQPFQVGVTDRSRVIDDALRQTHDRDVELVEAGGAVIERDLEHRRGSIPALIALFS